VPPVRRQRGQREVVGRADSENDGGQADADGDTPRRGRIGHR
jgi:hypothetical protein